MVIVLSREDNRRKRGQSPPAQRAKKEGPMFKIGKLFHLTHVVGDLAATDTWYDEVFSVCRWYRAYMKPAVREASLLCIGDCVMEPIQLARVPGAEQSPVGKFYARFGQRFHSIAWYVEDV